MEAEQSSALIASDDLWDEAVPYSMGACVLIQVSGFITIASVIFCRSWSAVQAAS